MSTIEDRANEYEAQVMSHEIDPERVKHVQNLWDTDPRWKGVKRP